jgi:hypothetical protein
LLSNTEAADQPAAEVEDKTYEAVAAYQARYRETPKALVVSLAGSTFSSDPSISPAVQTKNDLIYTEASFGGVRLTWLAVSNQEQRSAALRVQHFVRKDAACSNMKLVLDGRERVVPTVSKAERASAAFKQTVHGEMDLQAIQDVARAKRVVVDVCGTVRAFSALAKRATVNFANAYQELGTKPPPPPVAAPPVAEAAIAATAATQAAPPGAIAPEPVAGSPDGLVAPVASETRDVR